MRLWLYFFLSAGVIIRDRDSRTSRGFGFITFASPDHAHDAIKAMNNKVKMLLRVVVGIV